MALTVLPTTATAVSWLRAGGARALCTDSRHVHAGDAFLAWRGVRDDGRRHVADALAAGAACCLVDDEGIDAFAFDDRRIACASGLKASAGAIGDVWHGHPSHTLDVVAVTGTNGKTSVAWWTAQALAALGRRCGVIGTLGVGEPPRAGEPGAPLRATGLTTPDAVMLQAALGDFVTRGFVACTMEASSIGLVDHRLTGTRIAVAQFTNFTQDHLDYHGDMPAYWAAKRTLFGWPGLRAAVINIDDEHGAALADELAGAGSPPALWTYSLHGDARLCARDVRYEGDGLRFDLVEGGTSLPVRCRLIGRYNVSNLLAVIGALRALGIELAETVRVVPMLSSVPGRMQSISGRRRDLPADGGRLRAHARRARAGLARAAPAGAGTRRPVVVRVRLRRQPRRHQASADGCDRAPGRRPRGADQRQPARRDAVADPVADAGRHPRQRGRRCDRRPACRDPRGGAARRRARRGLDRRQGARRNAGGGRSSSARSATRRWLPRRWRCAAAARGPPGDDDVGTGAVDGARCHVGGRWRDRARPRAHRHPQPACRRPVRRAARRTTSTATPFSRRRARRAPRRPSPNAASPTPRCPACWSATACARCRSLRRRGASA